MSNDDFKRLLRRWRYLSLFNFNTFKDLLTFNQMLKEMFEDIPQEILSERKFPNETISKIEPFLYGYSIKISPYRKPRIREFNTIKHSNKSNLYETGQREPLIDVICEEDVVEIIAELSGIDISDINISCTKTTLTITVDTPKFQYHKKLDLPDIVDPINPKTSYKNGVLQIRLKKLTKKTPKSENKRIM